MHDFAFKRMRPWLKLSSYFCEFGRKVFRVVDSDSRQRYVCDGISKAWYRRLFADFVQHDCRPVSSSWKRRVNAGCDRPSDGVARPNGFRPCTRPWANCQHAMDALGRRRSTNTNVLLKTVNASPTQAQMNVVWVHPSVHHHLNSWPTFSPYLHNRVCSGETSHNPLLRFTPGLFMLEWTHWATFAWLQAWNQHNYDGHELSQ